MFYYVVRRADANRVVLFPLIIDCVTCSIIDHMSNLFAEFIRSLRPFIMEIAVLFALDHYKLIDHNVVSGREKKIVCQNSCNYLIGKFLPD